MLLGILVSGCWVTLPVPVVKFSFRILPSPEDFVLYFLSLLGVALPYFPVWKSVVCLRKIKLPVDTPYLLM